MSTPPARFDVIDGEGENTRIHYVMSEEVVIPARTEPGPDGTTVLIEEKTLLRKLKEADIVLEGRISGEDVETIREYIANNRGFDPDKAGVPDLVELMPLSWVPSGNERHDIAKIGFTASKPTPGSIDADHFTTGFQTYDYRAALSMG
ncbi:hypothetical protein HFO56_23260 [Rhizobium laguerreae]|uniref:hypothetical protein n=1 Tax=Rhizobium laguerreae TaxID=1076926 RepID=UPI001C92791A|nr:hypothetical protein [Rhizobium laguerreae]MBY3155245.1 hypothetical protein [Rhizobium laguerreae]